MNLPSLILCPSFFMPHMPRIVSSGLVAFLHGGALQILQPRNCLCQWRESNSSCLNSIRRAREIFSNFKFKTAKEKLDLLSKIVVVRRPITIFNLYIQSKAEEIKILWEIPVCFSCVSQRCSSLRQYWTYFFKSIFIYLQWISVTCLYKDVTIP